MISNIKGFIAKNRGYSITIVRLAIAFVLLWFGISQLINQESFIGYVPQWLYPHDIGMQHDHPIQFMHNIPTPSLHVILMANGIFDTVAGILLLLGLFTRIASFIVALHLLGIAFSLGYNDIAIRDIGLAIAASSLIFSGAGPLSIDNKKKE